MIKNEVIEIIKEAIEMQASDIHFSSPDKDTVLVQLRTGNLMLPRRSVAREQYEKMLAYVRFNASMDLSHPMQAQSGGLVIQEGDDTFSCRVSILPTAQFQSMVLRVVNISMGKDLDEIPAFSNNSKILKELATMESGLILLGGPTSSGKTTTAYAMIDYLKNTLEKNVITIEDPIEYQQPNIAQMQVGTTNSLKESELQLDDATKAKYNEEIKAAGEKMKASREKQSVDEELITDKPDQLKISDGGMNYDVGIKEILRHDPDVIIIGEIRDKASASSAVRAALTGHLVISTIHSRDNLGSVHRMMDLGMTATDLSHSLVGLVNQRLVPVGNERKALFEICRGNDLETVIEQVSEGSVFKIPNKTIDEEFLMFSSIQPNFQATNYKSTGTDEIGR